MDNYSLMQINQLYFSKKKLAAFANIIFVAANSNTYSELVVGPKTGEMYGLALW